MKKFLSMVCSATIALGASSPLYAAPLQAPQVAAPAPLEVIQVQQKDRPGRFERGWRQYDRADRREWRKARREWRRAARRGDYWNGHRGYRHYRHGYRRHGDFWFPLAAFAAGAIISGAIQDRPTVRYRGGSAHVEWCYDRYRSYRAYDNTFQPYEGDRRQCYSPYS